MKDIIVYGVFSEDVDQLDIAALAIDEGAYSDSLEEAKTYVEENFDLPETFRYFKLIVEELK